MSSRLLLSGVLASPAVRRKRNADGDIFAVARVRDTDRFEPRIWTCFINDRDLIEQFEEMRVGEPLAIAGPFSVVLVGPERAPRIEHRITAEALLDVKRRKKPKTLIRREERIVSDEADQEPSASVEEGLNDELPF